MAFNILSTSPSFGYYAKEPLEYFKDNNCHVRLTPQGETLSEKSLLERMTDVDAVIVGFDKITKAVIDSSKKLQVIAKHGAGVDNIDVDYAIDKGIEVISAPGTNSDAVADLTLGLFLSLARSIPLADQTVKKGGWPRIVGNSLNNKTVGIIGLGLIGKKVATRLLGFSVKILAYDPVQDEEFALKNGIGYKSLDEVLERSDFISIHVPLNEATRDLIGNRELKLMKKSAVLVNVARGGIIDEEALNQALLESNIGGAALDVFLSEPPSNSNLIQFENVIATPHMGGYTLEALKEAGMICARGIVDILKKAD